MPQYSNLTIHNVFEDIWSTWPNQDGEHAALKAVTFFLKENKKEDLIAACEAYTLSVVAEDPKFTYKLANFINFDHWRDVLEANNLDKLRKKRDEALHLIEEWNKACRPHWLKTQALDIRIPLAQKALENKYFRENWVEALSRAVKIFAFRFREGDPREKLKLTFKWFANVDHDKHTTLKIMEGEYGGPYRDRIIETIPKDPINWKARQRLAEEMKVLFPALKFEPPQEIKKEVIKIEISDEAKNIASQITSQLGKRPFIRRDRNSVETIVGEISEAIPEGSPEEGSEPDPFAFD